MRRRDFLKNVAAGIAAMATAPRVWGQESQPGATQPATGRGRGPNVIFILADDLGYGDLGCYGQKRIRTPNLDKMAAEGMRFTDFYSGSPVCAPSRCVLMTGLHTGHSYIRGNSAHGLRPRDLTVAEVLKRAGYSTALVGKWGLGEAGSEGVPTRKGFDYFYGYLNQVHAHNYYPAWLWRNEQRVALKNIVPKEGAVGQGVATVRVEYSDDLFIEEALKYVEEQREGPFFLYLALTIPHANNEAGDRGMEVPELDGYKDADWPEAQKGHAAMISRMDEGIGRLLQKLKDLKLDENTLVIFSSDNGPHREGGNDPEFNHSSGPFRGIKRDLYEGGIRIPFIARWPGRIPAGSVCSIPGFFGDFLPTMAELAATTAPDCDGISLVNALGGRFDQQKRHDHLYWEFYENGTSQAVRMENWKAVRRPMLEGKLELFDLSKDPGEKMDLAAKRPDVAQRMARLMDDAHRPSKLWRAPGEPAATE